MLPSQSTLAKDPSLFPLCGAGTATLSGLPVAPAGDDVCAAADFGALIADLNLAEPPAGATAPDLGACCLPVLGLAFVPPPAALAPEPHLAADGAGVPAGADDGTGQTDERLPLWAGRTEARSDWSGRVGGGFASGPRGESAGRVIGLASAAGTEDLPSTPRPAGTASEQATQTPRFVGLPAAALEHRSAATLPPGIARLQAQHAATGGAATPPQEIAAGPLPAAASADPGVGPQVPFRGAVLAKPDHPGEAARAALERHGFAAGEAIHPRSDRTLPLEEKIAGRRDGFAPGAVESVGLRKKSFLGTEDEMVVKQGRSLGTDGAKSTNAMPAMTLNSPPTHPNSHYVVTSVAPAGQVLAEVTPLAETAETFSTAHEAVEVVLHALEHVASREQKSVQLKFAVAGEELAVRVELRADEVRTTFRTDSAELRAALEHEWQQVAGNSTASDRSMRVSPAVFAAAGESANAFAGDTSSRDRRAGTPRDEFELPVAGIRGRTVAAAVHDIPLPVAAAPSRSGGTHRLHTLA